jgi:CheY-like chemotaxis protein
MVALAERERAGSRGGGGGGGSDRVPAGLREIPEACLRRRPADNRDVRPHRHSVLVIDDDVDVLDAFTLSLTLADVVVHAVSSGREALDLVDRGLRPCALLLDIRMPDMDGWQVWERLRHGAPEVAAIPVVFVSAEPPDRRRAAAESVAAWLQKPVGVKELAGALHRVCPVR